jgi:metal-responsive CopG/Arc/MetJ family transcriptional regulator
MKSDTNDKGRVSVTVRIPEHVLKRIDASLDQEDVPVSRNHWIIEALVEKLRRADAGGGSNGAQ